MSDNSGMKLIEQERYTCVTNTLGVITLELAKKGNAITISYQENVFGSTYYLRCTKVKSGGGAKTVTQTFTENQVVDISDPMVVVDAIINQMK